VSLAHVAVLAAADSQCARCGKLIEPPRYDSDDLDSTAVCYDCRKRPCEGWSAYCHECRCAAGATGMCRCGATWTDGKTSHCAACHLTFTTVSNFDAHRTGRRCLTAAEFRERGYEPNANGYWRKPAPEGTTWPGVRAPESEAS
jgi:hypothetical protein